MNMTQATKRRGRPTAFDRDAALEQAMQVFWTHGYEGASMNALTEAMGINKPSLYGAFGSKEELFAKALQRYLAGPVSYVDEAIQAPTARAVVEKFLARSIRLLTHQPAPRGCMVVLGSVHGSTGSELVRAQLAQHRQAYENQLQQRFAQAQADGDLPAQLDTTMYAKYIATLHQGLSVQAASGASEPELMAVMQQVLNTWPLA